MLGWALALAAGVMTAANAALEVDFVTTRGTITATMEYGKAPKAVANLLTLAQGTRTWLDPLSGQVRNTSFYNGLSFINVTNTGSQKTIETGSITGTGGDDPGYAFPDEIASGLSHEAYVLSMSNSGPNTQGARFCFTGSLIHSNRDGRNTVFGKVTSPASRAVIDNILSAGSGNTMITTVQVRRTDTAAQGFDEFSVPLPVVSAAQAPLRVRLGTSVDWLGTQPVASVLRAHQSTDLITWMPHFRNFVGLDDPVPTAGVWVDDATVPRRFYQFCRVTCPDAGGVTSFANRTLTIESPGTGTLIYRFNSAGSGGTYENIVFPEEPPLFSGSFQVRNEIPAILEPYSFRLLVYANGLGGAPFNLIKGGLDNVGAHSVSGHHVIGFSSSALASGYEETGTLSLSRP